MPIDFTLLAFWAKKIVAILVLPPAGPLLLILLGLMLRRARALAWLGLAYALIVTMPATVNLMAEALEPPLQAVAPEAVAQTGAIVILGAGVRSRAPEYPGGETVGRLALERLRYGALLARNSGKPVLVSGGAPHDGVIEAVHMRRVLEDEFKVPVQWVESQSLDTRDNANFSARLLAQSGIEAITLVTHAAHMPRAQRAFEAAGLRVTPAPTVWVHNPAIDYEWHDFIPSPGSAFDGWLVIHEWLGNLAYRLSEPASDRSSRSKDLAISPSTATPSASTPQSSH